jgi:hypothetical protein
MEWAGIVASLKYLQSWAPTRPSTSLCSLPLSLLLPLSAGSLGGAHAWVADVRESAGNSGRPARPRA